MHSQDKDNTPKLANVLANWQNRLGRPPKKSRNVKTLTFQTSSSTSTRRATTTRTKQNPIIKRNLPWNKIIPVQQHQFAPTFKPLPILNQKTSSEEDIYKLAFYEFPLSLQIVRFY